MKNLKEPTNNSTNKKKGDILSRAFAFIIDMFITLAFTSLIWSLFYLPVWKGIGDKSIMGMVMVANPVIIAVRALYFAFFNSSKWMGTPGKKLLGLKVVDDKGNRISFWDGIGRFIFKVISIILLGLGLVPALFKKKTLYDYMLTTKVIQERADKKTEFKPSVIILIITFVSLIITTKLPANTEAQDRLNTLLKEIKAK